LNTDGYRTDQLVLLPVLTAAVLLL